MNVFHVNDILQETLLCLLDRPSHLLLLSQTCKHLFQTIQRDDELWFKVYQRQQTLRIDSWWNTGQTLTLQYFASLATNDLLMSPVPNFQVVNSSLISSFAFRNQPKPSWPPRPVTDSEKQTVAEICRRSTFLLHGSACMLCGHKHGLKPVWKLQGKLCDLCFRDNLISNTDLFLLYGVDFWSLFRTQELLENVFFFRTDWPTSHDSQRVALQRFAWTHMFQTQPFRKAQVCLVFF